MAIEKVIKVYDINVKAKVPQRATYPLRGTLKKDKKFVDKNQSKFIPHEIEVFH